MSTFETPEPISVTLELTVGTARIVASDRDTTVVNVQPSDRDRKSDVRAAEQTRVEYANGRLSVKTPKSRGISNYFGKGDSVDIVIELPAQSSLRAKAKVGDIESEGQLAECHIGNAAGSVYLDRVGPLHLEATAGNVAVNHATGQVNVTLSAGDVDITELSGTAVVKNSAGNCSVKKLVGELQIKTAYGNISIDSAEASITAATAYGNVRVGDISRGSIAMETAYGNLEAGVGEGTAAWLDVDSKHGKVRNMLSAAENPTQSENIVEIKGRTSYGDVIIRRA